MPSVYNGFLHRGKINPPNLKQGQEPYEKFLVTLESVESNEETCEYSYKLRKASKKFNKIYLNEHRTKIHRSLDKERRDERNRLDKRARFHIRNLQCHYQWRNRVTKEASRFRQRQKVLLGDPQSTSKKF